MHACIMGWGPICRVPGADPNICWAHADVLRRRTSALPLALRTRGVWRHEKAAVIYSLVVALSAAALGVAACSSGPSVTSNYDKSAEFARYRTYGFVAQPNTQRLGYSSVITQQVEAAVTQQMEQRGYTHSDNPDLLVNFSGKMQQRQELQSTPGPAYGYRGYYGYRAGMYGVWSGYPSVYTVNYSEGTLNIDIVDASPKSKWSGKGSEWVS